MPGLQWTFIAGIRSFDIRTQVGTACNCTAAARCLLAYLRQGSVLFHVQECAVSALRPVLRSLMILVIILCLKELLSMHPYAPSYCGSSDERGTEEFCSEEFCPSNSNAEIQGEALLESVQWADEGGSLESCRKHGWLRGSCLDQESNRTFHEARCVKNWHHLAS